VDTAAFGEDQACGAHDAFLLRNNAAHLIDQEPPTYINWSALAGSDDATGFMYPSDNETLVPISVFWQQTYVHRWTRIDRPTSVHLRVRAKLGIPGSVSLRARVVPASFEVGDLAAPSLIDVSATVSTTTFAQVIDTYAFSDKARQDLQSSFVEIQATADDGSVVSVPVSLMRLEFSYQHVYPDPSVHLGYVWLRGFAPK
jgi:hypothetical protein